MTAATRYEDDVVAWANEQARFLREGRIDLLDIAHLAEEIEDVGKSEQRELASRMSVLLAHLLKWQLQPGRRASSWQLTIRNQRRGIARRLDKTPSLKPDLGDPDWWMDVWDDATAQVASEAGWCAKRIESRPHSSTSLVVAHGRRAKDAARNGQAIPAKRLETLAGK